MFLIPFSQRRLPPRTVWVCPEDGCDYRELGYPNGPLGRGFCRRHRKTRAHPRRRLVRQAEGDADPGRRGLRGSQQGEGR